MTTAQSAERIAGPAFTPIRLARTLGLPDPTPEQVAVIGAPMQPLVVIAGAGSGKSETMAARLVWLAANGFVHPDRVLGLTFTRKATAELAGRVRSRLDRLRRAGVSAGAPATQRDLTGFDGGMPADPVVSTYHAYAGRLVAEHALRDGLEPGMRLLTPAQSWQFAARIAAAYDGPMDEVTWSPPTVIDAVLGLAGELAEHLRDPADVAGVGAWLAQRRDALPGTVRAATQKICAQQRVREQLVPLVVAYTREKAAREVLDHGDQVAIAARVAQRHPEVAAIERARYAMVLLDEFQDTSHAQLTLLRALFGDGHPVTAVGDPCQSIYAWRGASAGNLRRFATAFPAQPSGDGASGQPARVLSLSTSFRNAGRVLTAAAAIRDGLPVDIPDVPVLSSEPARAHRGAVRCGLLETVTDEAEWVAARIAELLASPAGTAPDGQPWPAVADESCGVRPSDIAVLCRKRSQFPAIRRAVEALGIPVEVVGTGGLLTVPEVQDVVATLRVLHDADASDSLVRLLTGPRWRIGARDLVALGRRASHLADANRGAAGTRGRVEGDRGAGRAGDGTASDRAEEEPFAAVATELANGGGSLVEALDDLGNQAAYSTEGRARLRALGAELRLLRGRLSRPLPDLVADVERTLNLDVEVASRPGADPFAARADLDALAEVAAAFAGERSDPTLGAFLAYLSAAEAEEFGLETAPVSDTDTVKILTVHAAKGLQWPAVFVPGLAAGGKSAVFPARSKESTRWTDNPRLLPFPLRGDAADLPTLDDLSTGSIKKFAEVCAARDLAEERRLMYVATTRAAFLVACSGYWWGPGATPLGPSVFLEEIRAACQAGAGSVACWAPAPAADAVNPHLADPTSAWWPATPEGPRHQAVREAAGLVTAAARRLGERRRPAPAPAPEGQQSPSHRVTAPLPDELPTGPSDEERADEPTDEESTVLSPADQALVAAWQRDVGLLLAERRRRDADDGASVPLPDHLSVSSLVALTRHPDEFAARLRRPMPRPPAPEARRGTAFHRWLEERYDQQRLIDDDDLFAASDDPTDEADDASLARLRARFEDSPWARSWPYDVEVPFETLIAGRLVRGRVDAVFRDSSGGGFEVVDWKTGRLPDSAAERHAVAVQLAVYRLAWARLAGTTVDRVRAAFHYVAWNRTVRPADLLDEAGLVALIEAIPLIDDTTGVDQRRSAPTAIKVLGAGDE